ncbi:sugar phosphate isomerase/epimerase family protein, partial [Planctomycetota bacterium]
IAQAAKWIQAASQTGAQVSRIFGGHIGDRNDESALSSALEKVLFAMKELASAAEDHKVILAVENHGGVPGLGEEQVKIIEEVNSPFLRATVDVGNYMSCGQDPVEGSSLAAPYCAYVHFKDMKKSSQGLESCVVGEGDVDHAGCLEVLNKAGYNGYVALEYEGSEDEREGVRKSVAFMHEVMSEY